MIDALASVVSPIRMTLFMYLQNSRNPALGYTPFLGVSKKYNGLTFVAVLMKVIQKIY
jgi:hypothetical protein